jgi:hypothetical protein
MGTRGHGCVGAIFVAAIHTLTGTRELPLQTKKGVLRTKQRGSIPALVQKSGQNEQIRGKIGGNRAILEKWH